MARTVDPDPVAPDAPKPIVIDVATALSPLVRRITAGNPGKMTGPGTNTYLVGIDEIVVIDPGPDDPAHLDAIAGCGGDRIRWIVCTHTHPDHSPGAAGLKERTGAEVLAYEERDGLEIDRALGQTGGAGRVVGVGVGARDPADAVAAAARDRVEVGVVVRARIDDHDLVDADELSLIHI